MMLTIENALPAFQEYGQSRGLAAGTVERHVKLARQFIRTVQDIHGQDATLSQVDHQCVSRFFATLGGEQGHRNNALESVRAFLTWATRFGYLEPPLTAAVLLEGYKSRPAERQPKHYLEASEFPAALEAAGRRNPVDRAVVALALFTLARQSEIASLALSDLDLDNRAIRIRRHKAKHWTETGVTPELAGELRQWLITYSGHFGYFGQRTMTTAHPDWYLVPSRRSWKGGYRLQPAVPISMMERVAQRVLADLGVTELKGEGMHTFRRSGARAMLKHLSEHYGHDRALVQVSIMLDHKDTKMTLRYIGMEQERQELNEWLKGHSMYGKPPEPSGATVIPFRALA